MKRPADSYKDPDALRNRLIGPGKRYYPELQARFDELERFRALLDHSLDAIFLVTVPEGGIVDATGAACTMLQRTREDLLGLAFFDLVDPEDAGSVQSLFSGLAGAWAMETRLTLTQGGVLVFLPVEMTIRVVNLAEASRAVIVVRDATERKQAQERLARYQRELEQRVEERTAELKAANIRLRQEVEVRRQAEEEADRANTAKTEFLSMVSHELRTPMTSVLGFTRIIERKLTRLVFPELRTPGPKVAKAMEQVLHDLRIISAEGTRLTRLINDVLDLSKLEAGKMILAHAPVSLREVGLAAADAVVGLFSGGKVRFEAEIAAEDMIVTGDRDRLMQVILNLLSNAAKYTSQGYVRLHISPQAREVVTSVEDSGPGIPPEDKKHIFDKFAQVEGRSYALLSSTGLGLAISKHLVESQAGRIWLESEPGRGSRFAFALPLAAEMPAGSSQAEEQGERRHRVPAR